MSSNSESTWDLSIDNRNGQRILVVEVKTKRNASPKWASQLRRNILAHGTFVQAPYFLMVFPDQFYLWTDADDQPQQNGPDYIIDARPILKPYFERAGVSDDHISSRSLELIIAAWLAEIMQDVNAHSETDASQQWLIDSGLYLAIAGGTFEPMAVA